MLLTSLFAANPNVEKQQLVYKNEPFVETFSEETVDLNQVYLFENSELTDRGDRIKEILLDWYNSRRDDEKISGEVLNQTFAVLDHFYPSLFEFLDPDDIYRTPYGTVVFDWEKDKDNIFSLEVGADRIGYFIEVDGRDQKQIDGLRLQDNLNELMKDLSNFLPE